MSWLYQAPTQIKDAWLQSTSAMLLASLPDGTILWTNEAFQKFIGYTAYELEHMTWFELSVPDSNLEADKVAADQLMLGYIPHYEVKKYYIPKNEAPRWVRLFVQRYPSTGEFECCLVTVFPIEEKLSQFYAEMLERLDRSMEPVQELVDIIKRDHQVTESERLAGSMARLINTSPAHAKFWFFVIVAIIIGPNFFSTIKAVIELLAGVP